MTRRPWRCAWLRSAPNSACVAAGCSDRCAPVKRTRSAAAGRFDKRGTAAGQRASFVGRAVTPSAQVAELVDALDSGSSDRKVVEVRVFSWAPFALAAAGMPATTAPAVDARVRHVESWRSAHRAICRTGVRFGAAVAMDTETMGLNPVATGCAWSSSPAATATRISCGSPRGQYAAPRLTRCWPIRRAEDLPFRPLRPRRAQALSRRRAAAGLLHQDRLQAAPAPSPTGTGSRIWCATCSEVDSRRSSRPRTGARPS